MPTSGSAGIPDPLPVDVDDSSPIEVNVQEPVSVDDNGGSLTVDGTVTISNLLVDDEYEILCDSNGPFLRQYRTDPSGVITSDNFQLDGVTPYIPFGPVTRCNSVTIPTPVPVTDNGGSLTVDGAVSVTNLRDDEWEILCDSNGSFMRRYRTDSAGVVTSDNFLLDGTTAYVPFGPVTRCNSVTIPTPVPVTDNGGSLTVDGAVSVTNLRDDEFEVLCDSNGPFLRRYRTDSAGVTTSSDFLLDGTTAYVTLGPVTVCASGGGGGDDFEIVPMCDTIPQNELWAIQPDGANYDLIQVNPLSGATTVLLNNFTTEGVNALAWVPSRQRLYGRVASGAGTNNVWEIDPYGLTASVIGTVTGLPAGTWIFGAYDPNTDRWIVGGNSLPLYAINLTTLVAERASSFTLPAGGSGDLAFDECGRCYISSDGVITRLNALLDTSPTTIATVPNNGSGFSGSGYWKDGFFIGSFNNGEVFSVNTSTGQITTGLGPIPGTSPIDMAADPRAAIHVPFNRVMNMTAGTFADEDAEGNVYTIEGTATLGACPECCTCGEPGDRPFGNPVAITVSVVTGGGSLVTSASARRVQAWFEGQPAAGRDTINGVILPDTATDTIITFGDLSAPGHVPPITFASPGGSGREILVTQEF